MTTNTGPYSVHQSDLGSVQVRCAAGWPLADVHSSPDPQTDARRADHAAMFAAAPAMLACVLEGAQAARRVIVAWESGDLAQAVRDLAIWLEQDAQPTIAEATGEAST